MRLILYALIDNLFFKKSENLIQLQLFMGNYTIPFSLFTVIYK